MNMQHEVRKSLWRAYPRYGLADRLFLGSGPLGVLALFVDWRLGLTILLVVTPVLYWWKERELGRAFAREHASGGADRGDPDDLAKVELLLDGTPESVDGTSASRGVLRFPTDRAFGTVYTRPSQDVWRGSDDWWANEIGNACGGVRIPTGAQVRLWASQRHHDGTYRSPTDLTPLRRFEPDVIDSLYVGAPVGAQLDNISHLEGLRELVLNRPLDDDLLPTSKLEGLTRLRGFHVTYTPVTDQSIEPLVRRYRDLRYLYLNGTAIGDDTLRTAASLEGLKALKVARTLITDDGAQVLADLTGLTEIDLSKTQLTNAGITVLRVMESMQRLWLSDTDIDDAGLTCLARADELRSLDLSGTHIDGSALTAAGSLPQLEFLNLSGTAVTDSTFTAIGQMPKLRTLMLYDVGITDDALQHLHGHPTLRCVSIANTGITPTGLLALLESLPNVTDLFTEVMPARTPKQLREFKDRLRQAPAGTTQLTREWEPPTETREQPWPGTWQQEELPPTAGKGDIRGIAQHPSGQMWIASFGPFPKDPQDGPSWAEPGWTPPREGPCVLEMATGIEIGHDGTVYLCQDRELWALRDGEWTLLINQAPGIMTDTAAGPDGTIWAIRNNRILYSLRSGVVTDHHVDLPHGWLNSVAVGHDGTVWIGSSTGLTTYTDGTWHTWQGAADGLPVDIRPGLDRFAWEKSNDTPIRSIAIDPTTNDIWIAGSGGIARYTNDNFELCAELANLPDFFNAIAINDTGHVFATGGRLLAGYTTNGWHLAKAPTNLMNDRPGHPLSRLQAIHAGPDGIWVGANEGALLSFSPEPVRHKAPPGPSIRSGTALDAPTDSR